jgi:pimeloyl-ACP methyl ester carboxylesterase
MDTVTSKDGTAIAFDRYGTGTPVILVGGAFQYRAFDHRTAKLARLISADHTVLHYDRRGRGDSGNTMPYTVEREIDDIQALIEAVGGSAGVFGMSSGGALALEAAKSSPAITKLALYEAPFIVDSSHEPLPDDFIDRLEASLTAGQPGKAATQFLRWVGTPAPIMTLMRCTPMWPKFKAVAPTLPYDVKIIAAHHRGQPLNRMEWAAVRMPALVAFGGKSPDWISNGMRALAGALPDGRSAALPGQNHMIKPEVLAPTLIEFFADSRSLRR